MPDFRGRDRPRGVVAADVLAGIKMYPVDYVEELTKKIGKINPKTGFVARRIKGQIRTLHVKRRVIEKRGQSTKYYDDQIESKIKQLEGMAQETKEIAETYKRTKGEKKERLTPKNPYMNKNKI